MQARERSAIVGLLGLSQRLLDLAQVQVTIEHVIDGDALEGVDLLAHVGDTPVGRQQAVAGIG
ncbi:hypothetical protein D3C85_1593490 [compost metagenome]